MSQTQSDKIVALARGWIGTPYHHQGSTVGAGCDCLGLVRGVYRDLVGRDAETPPPYSRDWAEAAGVETLLAAARRHLVEIAPAAATAGDVVVFRFRRTAMAKHVGILTSPDSMVHATESAPATEIALTPWWRRRIVAAFSFPTVVG